MTGLVPKKFLDKVRNIPSHLQYSSSTKGLKYAELLGAVGMMDKEKCITFTKEEYHRDYGKNAVIGLRNAAKKSKIPFLLRVIDDGREIIIFKNDLPIKA